MSVRVAVVDSGINAGHPHVGEVRGGVFFHPDGQSLDFIDRIGHGTAVAGVIREKCPQAELYAVRIFDRRLTANIDTLIRGLEWCLDRGIHIVNLSVGTANEQHRERLVDYLDRARAQDIFVVGAANMLPGMLTGAIDVESNPDGERDTCRFRDGIFRASPYPRPIPGLPQEVNLSGISFAVANCTGILAKVLETTPPHEAYSALVQRTSSSSNPLNR